MGFVDVWCAVLPGTTLAKAGLVSAPHADAIRGGAGGLNFFSAGRPDQSNKRPKNQRTGCKTACNMICRPPLANYGAW